tara:strand:- start:1774 stop:2004 length:231 start_codon:yes stop_codon:yes gene_type:complete
MKYTSQKIDQIYNYKSLSNNEKIDRLLEIDANQYTNCGIDSTKLERQQVKKNSTYIYKTIKKIDDKIGVSLLKHQD